LGSAPHPHALRIGPIGITPAGLAAMALLAVFVAGISVMMSRARRHAAPERAAPFGPMRLVLGAWAAVMISVGFLVYFIALAYGDWRAARAYRETECAVFGSALQEHEGSAGPGERRAEPSYAPLFAVRYRVGDVETYSSGYATPSALNFSTRAATQAIFQRFASGTTHPCWYDPEDPRTVLLVRGPGGAYVFALLPLPVLALGIFLMAGDRRRVR
jgi:hypothetical protein